MAVRISEARLESDTSRKVSADTYRPEVHGPALCPDLRCLCKLRYVPTGERQVKDKDGVGKQVDIDPYFGLPSSWKKEGGGHQRLCHYLLEPTVKKLVAQSHEITKIDPDAEPMLFGPRGLLAEFRLHILMKLLRGDGEASEDDGKDDKEKKPKSATAYVPIDKLQAPYFRIAHAILTLIERIRDHGFLEEFIRIKYADLSLSWDEYYFGPCELGRLHEYLLQHNQTIGGHRRTRPIAAVLKIDRSRELIRQRYGNLRVPCVMMQPRLESGESVVIFPNLYVDDEKLAHQIWHWEYALVCALPTTEPLKASENPNYHRKATKINFSVFNRSQVCRFRPREEH